MKRTALQHNGSANDAISYELKAAIPSTPQWKYASLPVRLTAEETERVFGVSLDGSTHELRNRAMLLVLARMGLRAWEVVPTFEWPARCWL